MQRISIALITAAGLSVVPLLGGCGDESPRTPVNAVYDPTAGDDASPGDAVQDESLDPDVAAALAERRALDESVWAPEVMALRYERELNRIADAMNGARSQLAALGEHARFDSLSLPALSDATEHEHGIAVVTYSNPLESGAVPSRFGPDEFRVALAQLRQAGYTLVMNDWHLAAFTPPTEAQPARSEVRVDLYALNAQLGRWLSVEADLSVTWHPPSAGGGPLPQMRDIVVQRAVVTQREGTPVFRPVMHLNPSVDEGRRASIQPLILRDIDGNGYDDIVILPLNRVYYNRGNGTFDPQRFVEHPPEQFHGAAIVADLTGDDALEFVCGGHGPNLGRKLLMYEADAEGRFTGPPTVLNGEDKPLTSVHAITAGDIDGDGDLDLFVAQYKPPSAGGQMPTPFYDAVDGFPAYLYRNNGDGTFTDVTEEAGLGPKRDRRTYSASLIDLDDDRDLDLVVVSDFYGTDIHLNDGSGYFTDVSDTALPNPHAFGMSHVLDDFNGDGKLDLYVIGMSSVAATRINRMGLTRPDRPDYAEKWPDMSYGNRMYLGNGDGTFAAAPYSDDVAPTGWSWGVASFDLENDGDRDLYVANGNRTGRSVEDYCSIFWRHDLFTGDSSMNPVFQKLFLHELEPVHDRRISWDGGQKNVLLMNEGSEGFTSVAFTMGVAFDYDARSTAAADIDGDGLPELFIVEENGDDSGQTLYVFRNRIPDAGHFIGLRFPARGHRSHLNGMKVTVRTPDGQRVARPVSDSGYVLPQMPSTVTFGLGETTTVESIEIGFLDGTAYTIENPAVDTYHAVPAAE